MEKALEAEGKAIPPHEEVLVDTDSPVQKDSDSGSGSQQDLHVAAHPVNPTNGHAEQQSQQGLSQQHQQNIGFADQITRYFNVSQHMARGVANILPSIHLPASRSNAVLDVYFNNLHNKPYYILDEAATRQRWQSGQLPLTVVNAINAVTAR